MPAQNQLRATIKHIEQVQHITEVQAPEVPREVTGHLLQQPSPATDQARQPKVAVALAEVVDLLREAVHRIQVVQAAQEVQVPAVQEVLVQVHHPRVEDNNRLPSFFRINKKLFSHETSRDN